MAFFNVPSGASIVPVVSGASDLGTSGLPFGNIYANHFWQGGSILSGTQGPAGPSGVPGTTQTFLAPLFSVNGIVSGSFASASQSGFLKTTDWNTFNNKQQLITSGNLTSSTPGVTVVGGTGAQIGQNTTINIQVATSSQSGILGSGDWANFNSKQAALTFNAPLSNNSNVISGNFASINESGFLTSADWNTFNNKANLTSNFSGVYFLTDGSTPLNQQGCKQFYQMAPQSASAVFSYGGNTPVIRSTLSSPAWNNTFGFMQNLATSGNFAADASVEAGSNLFAIVSGLANTIPGGFNTKMRFGLPDSSYIHESGCRIFVGLTNQGTNVPVNSDNPNGDWVGLQFCTASGSARQDTVFQITSKTNGANQTLQATTLTPTTNSIYDLYMQYVPNSSSINWLVKSITTNTQSSGSLTTNFPTKNSAMAPFIGISTQSSGAVTARNLRWSYCYVEAYN